MNNPRPNFREVARILSESTKRFGAGLANLDGTDALPSLVGPESPSTPGQPPAPDSACSSSSPQTKPPLESAYLPVSSFVSSSVAGLASARKIRGAMWSLRKAPEWDLPTTKAYAVYDEVSQTTEIGLCEVKDHA